MADYKKDSNYGWELRDKNKGKVIGVVDPGTKPDPKKHWLAYVNSACHLWQQNLVATQYRGAIWYRVVKPIAPGANQNEQPGAKTKTSRQGQN